GARTRADRRAVRPRSGRGAGCRADSRRGDPSAAAPGGRSAGHHPARTARDACDPRGGEPGLGRGASRGAGSRAAVRLFLQLLAVLALALLGAWSWRYLAADPGYVLISFAGWSMEATLLSTLLLALLAWL